MILVFPQIEGEHKDLFGDLMDYTQLSAARALMNACLE